MLYLLPMLSSWALATLLSGRTGEGVTRIGATLTSNASTSSGPSTWNTLWSYGRVPVQIVFLIALGILIRWIAFRLIDRMIRGATNLEKDAKSPGRQRAVRLLARNGLVNERQAQRAKALGSLLKSATTCVIGVTIAAMVLDKLGFNLAPFLASAGVVGVALGFGAQSLVKDLVSGVFMLLEDQYGVGDHVDLAVVSGTVEAVGLRVTRLRADDGVVWHVRNGEIVRVGNKSMGWAALTYDLEVAYDQDIDALEELINRVGREFAHEDAWHGKVLAAPAYTGVQAITPSAVTVRTFGRTRPGDLDAVEAAWRLRLKEAVDQAGVSLPE